MEYILIDEEFCWESEKYAKSKGNYSLQLTIDKLKGFITLQWLRTIIST